MGSNPAAPTIFLFKINGRHSCSKVHLGSKVPNKPYWRLTFDQLATEQYQQLGCNFPRNKHQKFQKVRKPTATFHTPICGGLPLCPERALPHQISQKTADFNSEQRGNMPVCSEVSGRHPGGRPVLFAGREHSKFPQVTALTLPPSFIQL
ncbi:hypothetical protein [Breoghania sp. L-A4]|uniref:hypothetical protein n=1 Tax=Breoghania sp. L-A4 TaxID=2304600 RepID=UPI0013C362B9|nr:hypothetical protein [Breoghania sp. L-A4]